MSEESSHRHHSLHHHSHSGGHGSSRHGRHHRRRDTSRAVDVDYERMRSLVGDYVSQNIGLLRAKLNRLVFLLGSFGVLLTGIFFFLAWHHHQEGSLLRLSLFCITGLGAWLLVITLFHYHKSRILDIKTLIQFQETRVDSLKAALSQKEKTIKEMRGKIDAYEVKQNDEPGDYRKMAGYS